MPNYSLISWVKKSTSVLKLTACGYSICYVTIEWRFAHLGNLESTQFLLKVSASITLKYITGPYSLSCKQKMFKTFGICPIILWYLGYLKQEKTKKSSEDPFQEDQLKFFPHKSSRDRKPRITKWSVWRSDWSKKSH